MMTVGLESCHCWFRICQLSCTLYGFAILVRRVPDPMESRYGQPRNPRVVERAPQFLLMGKQLSKKCDPRNHTNMFRVNSCRLVVRLFGELPQVTLPRVAFSLCTKCSEKTVSIIRKLR